MLEFFSIDKEQSFPKVHVLRHAGRNSHDRNMNFLPDGWIVKDVAEKEANLSDEISSETAKKC